MKISLDFLDQNKDEIEDLNKSDEGLSDDEHSGRSIKNPRLADYSWKIGKRISLVCRNMMG